MRDWTLGEDYGQDYCTIISENTKATPEVRAADGGKRNSHQVFVQSEPGNVQEAQRYRPDGISQKIYRRESKWI